MAFDSPSFLTSEYTWILAAIRILVLVFPSLSPFGSVNSIISSSIFQSILFDPVYTWHHVREAIAIRNLFSSHRFRDAYRGGGRIHLPPLLLVTLETFVGGNVDLDDIASLASSTLFRVVTGILLLLVDLRIAWNLQRYAKETLWREYGESTNSTNDPDAVDSATASTTNHQSPAPENYNEQHLYTIMDERIRPTYANLFPISSISPSTSRSSLMVTIEQIPMSVAQIYSTTATLSFVLTGASSFQNLPLLFLTEALVNESVVGSAFGLALATYLEVHNLLFAIPLVLVLVQGGRRGSATSVAATFVALLLLFTALFQGLSYAMVTTAGEGDATLYRSVVLATHLHSFRIYDMPPSLSILWYFSMEVFERFRLYFQLLFGGLPYCTIVIPATIRLYQYPSVLVRSYRLECIAACM